VRKWLVVFVALSCALWGVVYESYRLPAAARRPLHPDERAEVMRTLRHALDGGDPGTPGRRLERSLAEPIVVVLYDRGQPVVRIEAEGETLGAATERAAEALRRKAIPEEVRRRGRLKVDVILGRAPIVSGIAPVLAVSLVPGMDGLGLEFGARRVLFTVDDLLRADLLAGWKPLPSVDVELGLDVPRALLRLATEVGANAATWRATPRRLFRFRADSFVEPAPRSDAQAPPRPLPVIRGHVSGPPLERAALRAAAIAGGRYLLRHLEDDGHFDYEYYTTEDQVRPALVDYSLPRHAGATYLLAQLYQETHDPAFAEAARRAISLMAGLAPGACARADRACIGEDADAVELGSVGLGLTAVAEYQRVTGDRQFAEFARRLERFIVYMQRSDGDFCHLYDAVADRRDETTRLLYYSGEATLGLAKYLLLPDHKDDADARRALDAGLGYLIGPAYGHLVGQFYFGEDHWTCMAADFGWPNLSETRRLEASQFCDEFAAFLRRSQYQADEAMVDEAPDLLGAYGISPFIAPHSTPVGSRSETAISIYQMDLRKGLSPDDPRVRRTRAQILSGMRFLLDHQIDDDAAWLMPNPEAARGGFLMNDVKRYVRIDFVQHTCSAIVRLLPLL
jgi:hypothetical protein